MNKVKLGDMLTFQRGYDLTHSQMKCGKIPVVGSSEVIGWHNEAKVKAPVLLIGRSGTVGRPQFYEIDIWAHNTTLFVSDFHNNDPKFCFYFLKNLNLEDYANSSGVPTLNRNFIHPLIVKFPDKTTQFAITKILSSLDNKIELNNKVNKELENMAKTIYEYWFVQNADKKWERKKLEEIGEFKNGANYEKANTIGEKVKIVNVRNISSSSAFIAIESLDEIILPKNEIEKYLLNENDIIFARSGIPGAIRLIEKKEEDIIFCGFAIRFRLNDKNLRNYLFFPLKQNEEFVKNSSGGSIMPNITQDSLKDIFIIIPPTKVIQKFNKIVSPLFSTIVKNRQESAHLVQLRDFLLPLLMNGQVMVRENPTVGKKLTKK